MVTCAVALPDLSQQLTTGGSVRATAPGGKKRYYGWEKKGSACNRTNSNVARTGTRFGGKKNILLFVNLTGKKRTSKTKKGAAAQGQEWKAAQEVKFRRKKSSFS